MRNTIIILFAFILYNSLSAQEYYKTSLDTTMTSRHLGYDKGITITLPIEWQEDINKDFPLIVVFDRQNKRSNNYILSTIDYLTSTGQMPSSIIISVESTANKRSIETLGAKDSDNNLALKNENFIFDELIPLAENKYKASKFRLLIGHSRYGYFTNYLFSKRFSDLSGIISISPFYGEGERDLVDLLESSLKQTNKATKYYRVTGDNISNSNYQKLDSIINSNNNKSINCKGFRFEQGNHNAAPGLVISIALYEIFEEWAQIGRIYNSRENINIDENYLYELEEQISNKYGSHLDFFLGDLYGKGWILHNDGHYQMAIAAWELTMIKYPNFSEGYLSIIDTQNKLGFDSTKTIEKFKASLKKSTFYTKEEKIDLLGELLTHK